MYNCAEFAPKCIDNILSQTYHNWELWLVHGDSKDGTEHVCQKYEDQDSRIHNIFHIDGLVPARNVGYEHATGDWIMYLDGDDWIDGDCLIEIMAAAQKYDNPEVLFWKFTQDMDGKIIEGKWSFPNEFPEQLYVGDECKALSCLAIDYKNGIGESYAKIARLDYCKKHNLCHNKRLRQGMEGFEYTLRLFYNASRILFINKNYNHYRYNPESLSKIVSEKNAKYIHDSAIEMKIFIDGISNEQYEEELKYALYKRCLYSLLAVTMSTYFHPNNNLSYSEKTKRYKVALNEFYLFKESLYNSDYSSFDYRRKLAIFFIKRKLYFMLFFMSKIKYYMDSKGRFSY